MPMHLEVVGSCLSNFAMITVRIDNVTWKTSEHYFQAMKTDDLQWRERIHLANTPKEAKYLGRMAPMRLDWNDIRKDVMLKVLRAKVQQSSKVRDLLLASGDKPIRETAPWDEVWGTGKRGTGQNLLGKMWEQIRTELRTKV